MQLADGLLDKILRLAEGKEVRRQSVTIEQWVLVADETFVGSSVELEGLLGIVSLQILIL